MDIDSFYMAISGNSINETVRLELRGEYDKFLSTSNYHDRTPGLFKAEFQGTRMITLTSKCYYAEDVKLKQPKFNCKCISKKQNPVSRERYLEALCGSVDITTNTGFGIYGLKVVNYTQNKLEHSEYYDKQFVAPDGIHTKPLEFIR